MKKRRIKSALGFLLAALITASAGIALLASAASANMRLTTPEASFEYDGQTLYLKVTCASTPAEGLDSYYYEITDEDAGETVVSGFMGKDGVCSYDGAAPGVTYSATVQARPATVNGDYAESQVCIVEPYKVGYEAIEIENQTMPAPVVNTYYYESVRYSAGPGKVRFNIISGVLPKGLSFNAAEGVIYGTPSSATGEDVVLTVGAYYEYDEAYVFSAEVTVPAVKRCPVIINAEDYSIRIGSVLELKNLVTAAPSNCRITFALTDGTELPQGTVITSDGTITAGEAPGSFSVTITAQPFNGNYAPGTAEITVTVRDRDTALITASIEGWTYGSTPSEPAYTAVDSEGAAITEQPDTLTFEYKEKNSEDAGYTTAVPTAAGEYLLRVTFRSRGYYGTGLAEFSISPIIIEGADITVTLEKNSYTYTGSQIKPVIKSVKYGEAQADYTVAFGENLNAGKGTVVVTLAGNYSGSKTVGFTIARLDISACSISLDAKQLEYTGESRCPNVTAVALAGWSQEITYSVRAGSRGTYVGKYSLTIIGTGNYTGVGSASWEVVPAPQTVTVRQGASSAVREKTQGVKLKDIFAASSGAAVSFGEITDGGDYAELKNGLLTTKELTSDSAEVEISVFADGFDVNGDGVNEYTVFSGSVSIVVVKKETASITFTDRTVTYSGSEYRLYAPTCTASGGTWTYTYNGSTYSSLPGFKAAGAYLIYAVYEDADSYAAACATLTVLPRSIADVSVLATVEGEHSYTGGFVTPKPTLTLNGSALIEKTDYTITGYVGNDVAGSALINISGKGNFSGTRSVQFKIAPKAVAAADISVTGAEASYEYTGSAIQPEVTVTAQGADAAFDVDYGSNKNVLDGGEITVTLKGNYSGSKTVYFTIAPKKLTVEFSGYTGLSYNGTIQSIDVSVSGAVNGETVDAGIDYGEGVTVFNAGDYTAQAVITDPNYELSGICAKNFTVEQREVSAAAGDLKITKVYDTTDSAGNVSGSLSIDSGVILGDSVSIKTGAIPRYSLADAGTYTLLLPISLSGDDCANYKLNSDTYTFETASITKARIEPPMIQRQTIKRGNTLDTIKTTMLADIKANGVNGETVSGELQLAYSGGNDIDALQPGEYTIIYTFKPNGSNYMDTAESGTFVLEITELDAQSVAFEQSVYTAVFGNTGLSVKAVNSSQGGGKITYSSSKPEVASVAADGSIAIMGAGSAVITASAEAVSGKYSATYATAVFNVQPKTISGTVSVAGSAVYGEKLTASASIGGDDAAIKWQVSITGTDGWNDLSAEGAEYTVAASDIGQYIRAVAVGFGNYTGTVESAATAKVLKAAATSEAAAAGIIKVGSDRVEYTTALGQQYCVTTSAQAPEDWSEASAGNGRNAIVDELSAAGTYYIWTRVAPTNTNLPSQPVSTTVNTAFAAPGEGEGYVIDYINETITVTDGYGVYSSNDFTGKLTSGDEVLPAGVIYVRREADGNTPASCAAANTLQERRAAPVVGAEGESIDGEKDGVITGTAAGMEYKAQGGAWADITGASVTGCAPGKYFVRYSATAGAFAGFSAEVNIASGSGRSYDLTVRAQAFEPVEFGYAEITPKSLSIISAGNSNSTITEVAVSSDEFIVSGSGDTVIAGQTVEAYKIAPVTGLSAGTHTATVTVYYNGTSAAVPVSFTVSKKTIVDTYVSLNIESVQYTGAAQTPAPKVAIGNADLSATSDYTVEYDANKNAGTAKVTVKGTGNYTGTVIKYFLITQKPITGASVTPAYERTAYTGLELKPSVVVKLDGKQLGTPADYSVSYSKNVDAGTAEVTVKGAGNYTGTAVGYFTIDAAEQRALQLRVSGAARQGEKLSLTVSGGSGSGEVTYKVYSDSQRLNEVTAGISITGSYMSFDNIGEYYIVAYKAGGSNYLDAVSGAVKVTVRDVVQAPSDTAAEFVKVEVYAGSGGTALPEISWLPLGGSLTVKISPDEGSVISSVLVNGREAIRDVYAGADGTSQLTLTGVSEAATVEIVFEAERINRYDDVPDDAWYADAVKSVTSRGMMGAVSENSFMPAASITRADVAVAIWRGAGSPTAGRAAYSDVRDGSDAAQAIAWVTSAGIFNGYGNGSFGPNDSITREQLAAVLYRYSAYKGNDVSAAASLGQYRDAGDISDYALSAVKWAVSKGIIKGRASAVIAPRGTAARAEAATVFMRMFG